MNQNVNEDMIRDAATVKPDSQDYTLNELMIQFDDAIGSRRYNEDEIFVKFAGEFLDEGAIPNVLFERIIIDGVPRNTLVIAPVEDRAAYEKLNGALEDLKRELIRSAVESSVAIIKANAKAEIAEAELAEARAEMEDMNVESDNDAKVISEQETTIAALEAKVEALTKKLAKTKPAAKPAKPKSKQTKRR